MLATFTNETADQIFLSAIYTTIEGGASVTTRRTLAEIQANQGLLERIEDGDITVTFEEEAGDASGYAGNVLGAYSNTTRPDADEVPTYSVIYNTDDAAPNISDGTNWRMMDGTIT